ncbi:MAG TPA: VOC family protein [Solirubrobacteraceae bacterium]|nr:VOC family protein [Solirubrobacteraceae bacterium]
MEHVLVLTDDIDASREFYTSIVGLQLGARPVLEFPGFWLYAGATPCLHIAERRSYLDHAQRLGLSVAADAFGRGPVDHIAFNASDYDAVVARLEQNGVAAIRNTVAGGAMRQLFFDDPSGVRVEINVRNQTQAR